MPSEQFERTLRERFAQAEIPPPAGLWDRIEAGVAPPAQPKRRFLWIWWAMAALLFCTVGLAWVYQPKKPVSLVDTLANTAPAIPAPQKSEVGEECVEEIPSSVTEEAISQPFLSENSASAPLPASTFTSDQSALPSSVPGNIVIEHLTASVAPTFSISANAPVEKEEEITGLNQDRLSIVGEEETAISLFNVETISPFELNNPSLSSSTAIIPVTKSRGFGKWAVDISVASGYATRMFTPSTIEKSFQADYAGYANRSPYTANSSGQVATVRFPRWHHALSLETSRTLHPRWRLSLGLDLQAGLGGIATLGEIESSLSPPGGSALGAPIVVDESSIQLGSPSDFTHVSLGIPIRLSYLSSLGRGSLEHSLGYSLNRGWTMAEPQSQLESIAFDLNTDQIELFSDINLPPPVLYARDWHSDVRLRSRYFLPSRSALQPFVGVELQSQISPAFGGDAGSGQRPFLIGMEIGLRIR